MGVVVWGELIWVDSLVELTQVEKVGWLALPRGRWKDFCRSIMFVYIFIFVFFIIRNQA